MSTLLTFEHPLNERVRTFLRIEHLFERLNYFAPQYDAWATRVAVETLLDIASVTARADVKNELLKELDRNIGTLKRFGDQPGVDPQALDRVLGDLADAVSGVHRLSGPIGQIAREDDFLKSVAQRSSIPGGACSFDSAAFPSLADPGAGDTQGTTRSLASGSANRPSGRSVSCSRSPAPAHRRVRSSREGGFFQEALDVQAPAQMVRVGINGTGALYPEISGHKSRFSIRFMQTGPQGRPAQIPENIPFKLTCCVF